MDIYSHPDIIDILAQEDNNKCIDCGGPKPKWASLNNGVILCIKCAGIHRNFGVNTSIIRSLQIDSWDDKQILYLKKGGNNKYREMLKEYNLLSATSIDLKYKTKAADYYRKKLRDEVEKEANPEYQSQEIEKPDIAHGSETIVEKQNENEINNNDIIGSNDQPVPKEEESFFGFMGSFFKKATQKVVDTTKDLTKDIGQKVQNMNVKEKLKNVGDIVVENAKKGGIFVKEKTQQVVVN